MATLLLAHAALAQGAQGAQGGGEAVAPAPAPAPAPADAPTNVERAMHRFPQPVRVGDLTGRLVLEPSERQGALGHVEGVERTADGVEVIVRYGGVLGFGGRDIAVPVEATALLGHYLQIVDLDQAQLDARPTWTGSGGTPVPADEEIRVGINRN